jgi:hypothetical protein
MLPRSLGVRSGRSDWPSSPPPNLPWNQPIFGFRSASRKYHQKTSRQPKTALVELGPLDDGYSKDHPGSGGPPARKKSAALSLRYQGAGTCHLERRAGARVFEHQHGTSGSQAVTLGRGTVEVLPSHGPWVRRSTMPWAPVAQGSLGSVAVMIASRLPPVSLACGFQALATRRNIVPPSPTV